MAAAGNYSGSEAEKYLTVNQTTFSLLLPTSYPRTAPTMEEFGTPSSDTPGTSFLVAYVILLRSSADPSTLKVPHSTAKKRQRKLLNRATKLI
jgi:hypothetical protein